MPDFNSTTVKHALDASAGLDHADAVWELLAARIDLLVAAWEQGSGPPALGDFAPADPPNVRRLALCELAKIDMEYRFAQGFAWKVEDYLQHFPDLAAGGQLPCDLIYEEYHLRRKSGEVVAASEYITRFPAQADELRRLLDSPSMDRTTSLFVPVVSAGLEVGETIDDFDLLTQLGKGAFATVYLARQRSLQRLVALKASADAGTEPQTLAQLEHPHIVRVYDQRLVPDRDLRLLYMQYVPGGTLQDVIRRAKDAPPAERSGHVVLKAVDAALDKAGQGPPSDSSARQSVRNCSWPQVVCRLGQQLGSALDYAHRRGVLHRDLKPANVLMTAEGSPRLADFNISFCSKLDGASPAAYFGGSLAYMSPEQLEACSPQFARQPDSLDGRSDVYALGVVLWELLTGNRPFADEPLEAGWGATVEAMVARRRRGIDASMLKTLPAELPPGLVDVLVDCLAPNAEQRPATAAEAAARLRLCQHPDAQRLLDGANRGWRGAAQRFCVLAVVGIALVFNGVAAVCNLVYNDEQIIKRLPRGQATFWTIQGVTNGIAFPVGVAILVMLSWPLQRALRGVKGLKSEKGKEEDRWRIRALRLGHYTAVLGVVEWLLAGFAYPLAMNLAGVRLGSAEALHFLASLALCGLIAATYPFFGITFLGVRAFYVGLLPTAAAGPTDAVLLTRLARQTWKYLVLAATVPMLAVLLLVALRESQDRLPLFVLSAGSLLGFGLIFYLARATQADIQTLQWIVNPPSNAETSESDSFILPR